MRLPTRVSGNKKRKASYQRMQMERIYTYNLPTIIRNAQSIRFIYVLPKFVLSEKEKLELEVQELNGSRKVLLVTSV
ncbi:hypothetical protein PW52_01645 [Tamlana sedimentorum]|uniref:Uncharacterized protein n=1 Tax=Neotamlana sedimentorum TaxID=1435349 RepID=A0A0D7WDD4_9FLAO|nr:DUF4138 domain-containing protein [Tamlana sedimentorum]KJD37185.1 hypothetical protein PW52_01645 [Tamlana sedimentorum]